MNRLLIIILVIIIIAALGVGGYFLFKKPTLSVPANLVPSDRVTSPDPKVQHNIDSIYANPDWLNNIKVESAKKGISLDQGILENAQWCAAGNC